METILNNENSRKHYALKTEVQIHDACNLSDINTKERYITTIQNINNKQKLFDFISDKNKLSLNTYFDHKGTKNFLIGKNEAMRKIELDEKIELVQKKSEKMKKGSSISKKKLSKQKSAGFSLKRSSKKSLKIESSKKIKLKKKHNSLSTKNFIGEHDVKHNLLKEKFVHFDLKEHSADDDRITKSPVQIHKKKKSSLIKKKIKKNNEKEKINIDKSINSINTVNSKLFNNEKEYNNYKYFLTKDDVPILEDILYELDVNNK
jgi:hypothetical protein